MHQLTGYCDRWSVKPGGTIRFMVGSAGGRPFDLRFVRHVCADPNPDGPGYAEIAMPTGLDGGRAGLEQHAYPGSFGHVPALAADLRGGFTITATVWPTTPEKGRQGIVALAIGGWRLALGIGPGGGAMVEACAPGGAPVRAEVGRRLLARRWYDLTAAIDADGRLHVAQRPHQPLADAGEAVADGGPVPPDGAASVFLAAMPPAGAGPASAYFNGKLEGPSLHAATGGFLAAWDFAIGIPTQTAADTGPLAAHARLVNLPTRAMTGANWTGAVHDWKSDPARYGAIHFHDDDQGDLGWAESFALTVPDGWPSGFYAAHLRNEAGEDYIPFFVRPAKPSADVAFLVPTFSYQVYGCYVRPGRGAEIAGRAARWGALAETPDMNPQFGLSTYNYHSDGSGVSITSMRRPMLDTRPRQMSLMDPVPGGSGTGRICADSYIVQWLTALGQAHDIVTDHDLHAEGVAALAPYRVVIAGQHPEYHSERMMQGLEDYLAGGGRLMYLGGNGFYWRAEPSEAAPHAIEVRRAEGGIRVWETMPGESYHAFGGGYGGLWRRIGRSGHRLVGISFSTQGRHLGFPYMFVDGIRDPRVAFMTEGLEARPGAPFGDAGYMGGGAAGFELDSVNPKYGTPPHALVVAKGIVIHEDYGWVNEDMLTHRHPLPQEDWSCADMTFFETHAGGAVFSVGSMTYAGSLPVAGGQSTLGRLTANVLRRFVDPAPFALPACLATRS
ncbi:N,N-dimethylformamidase beta subunit family domain-containing protein [Limobrevibacterium gyesilva]|uniref:N,N-dimethylformamidase n=1 Tax=Limobrevibacterium gyesilva TaxID=2991712 RepID=A0AA42CGD5_9PROT|nr:N,N-dimethylformamidase beta subunit family domain-containing protein [Limobrevibacterium gyesilva]MCW3475936.1 N,N-dimethylformamidase [Limobrevibacterium gyesilva]